MSTQTNVDLGFPMRLYSLGYEPKPVKSINYHSKTILLEEVAKAVGNEVWDYIRASPLGVIVRFVEKSFVWSSKVVEYLLAKQLVCKKNYEIWCLFGTRPARFSLSEFQNITSLNCAPFPNTEDHVETNAHKELWEKMKVKENKNPNKIQLKQVCNDVGNWSREDKIRFAYLSILATVIIGDDEKKKLASSLARMVFDLPKFEKYPWGRVAFENLIKSVKKVDLEANSWTINGFMQVLQIWVYNVVPSLGSQIGRPANGESCPLLKFNGAVRNSNIDIDDVLVDDQDKIVSVLFSESAPTVWNDEGKDDKINTLMQAICKEGGLEIVTWVEEGSKSMKREDDLGVELAEKEKGDGDAQKTSLKRQKEMTTKGGKRRKSVESKAQFSSGEADTLESLRLRIEQLEKQATRIDAVEAQMKDMSEKLKSFEMNDMSEKLEIFETMRSKLDLLESEVKILKDKSATGENHRTKIPKNFDGYQLRDSTKEEMPIGDLFATLNAIKQKAVESDEESTVDGRPMLKTIHKEPVKGSSPIKILKPTVSLAEKFTQKKIDKTLNAMGINNALKNGRGKSTRLTKPTAVLIEPFRSTIPVVGVRKQINQPLALVVGRGYDPFASVDVQKVKVLDDWLRLDEEYPIGSQNNGVEYFKILRTPQKWLNEEHINSAMNLLRLRFMKNEKAFRSERIAFTDVYFTTIWSQRYQEFLQSGEPPIFPNGAFDYANGVLPAFAATMKKWRTDVDDIYGVLHVKDNHWVTLYISIPNGSIDVFDCWLKGSTNTEIVTAVNPVAHMLPHLLRAAAPPSERGKMKVQKYKIRRPRKRIPQQLKSGDCGIYAVKFVECHALGAELTTPLSDGNIKMVREKLAAEIFDETEHHGQTVSNQFPFGSNNHDLLHPY